MKYKKYQDVTTVPKSNRKREQTETKSRLLTHIHDRSLSLCTGTSMICGGVKLGI